MTHPALTNPGIRLVLARALRAIRAYRPGWSNARVREAAQPCPDCEGQERACTPCYDLAHADDHDERGA